MFRAIVKIVVAALMGVLLLGGIFALGRFALEQLKDRDRFQFSFSSIQCNTPAGMSRIDFLDEVHYLSGLPSELPLLEENLFKRLDDAFSLHPWVKKVDQIQLLPSEKTVRVDLAFRKPVLAIQWEGKTRAVDANGVLLPPNAKTEGLPKYDKKPSRPQGPAGSEWGDAGVLHAARKAAAKQDKKQP